MSKMDDLRAMREARYEATRARAAAPREAPKAPTAPRRPDPAPARAEAPAAEPEAAEVAGERLCGHRAISGRTCTREHGHTAKSHRYS